ncbi:cytochrome P450 [Nocardia spumae]|uniref:cytochrome P450 n=1 Tax=Nocardia spumae TaxID=2887190 RepID=UPI001D140324|nr:cytochrome P450 [Nocardia spumae]
MTITLPATSHDETRSPDLTEPATHLRPEMAEFWRTRRQRQPIFRHEATAHRPGFWVVCTHEPAMRIYRDATRFTSQRGNVLLTLLAGRDNAAGKMLAVTDPPRHNLLRRLMTPALTREAVRALTCRIRERTARLLAQWAGSGEFDFADEIVSRIPIWTICDLLGIPDSEHELLVSLTKQALSSDDAAQSATSALAARQEILLCLLDQVQAQRQHPAEGLIAGLIDAEFEGAPLTDDQIVTNCYSIILGGDETARLTMINAVHAFAADPELWRRFGAVDDLGTAVEEIIRCFAPTMHFGRIANVDVDIDGVRIEAGDIVTMWNISANRDERRFPDPDTVLFDRRPNPHLAFGYGPHFCIGAPLARLEIAIVLDELRRTTRNIVATAPPRPLYSNFLHGYATLPVAFG